MNKLHNKSQTVGRVSDSVTRQAPDAPKTENVGLRCANPTYGAWGMSFEMTTLGEFATVQGGYAYKSQDFKSTGEWSVLKIKNVRNGHVSYDDTSFVSTEVATATSKWATKPGDVLISMTGSGPSAPESLVGRTALVWKGEKSALINQRVGRLMLKESSNIDLDFLFYLLSLKESQDFLVSNSTGSANQVNISAKTIESVPCPKLDHDVSKDIASILLGLDGKIRLLRETNATLEAIALALFKSWFVDFDPVRAKQQGHEPEGMDAETAALFPDSFEESELGLVPKGWRVANLADAFEINPTRALKKGSIAPYLDMAKLATSGHCVDTPIQREMGSGTKFRNGDTLLARITPCLENGKSAFVDFLADDQIGWGSTEFLVLHPKAPLPEYFGYLLCRHPAFREYAVQSMSGTSGRQRIQNDVLGRFLLALPDDGVASAFTEVVDSIQRSIAGNHETAQTLAALRDTLLPRLIYGQLRLPDAEVLIEETV